MSKRSLSQWLGLLKDKKYQQMLRFGIVGVLNTAVDFAVFTLCIKVWDIHYLYAQVAGFAAGVTNSFIFNKLWTFESRTVGHKTTGQFIQFLTVSLTSLGITLIGLRFLVGEFGMNKFLAKLAVTLLAQFVNFLGYKLWVFKKDETG